MSHIHIDVEQVSFGYEKGKEILGQISLHASERDSIGIIGANGVGKSTFLKLLVGLNLDFSGSIRVEEIPVEKRTLAQIRSKIGYVFQDSDSQLFMNTAYEDIAFAPRNYGLPEQEVDRRVEEALRMTGISHLKEKQIYKMSGGEKKLVSIATILSMTPDIILMDEPSIALDPRNRRNLIRILNSFEHLKIIASHDLDLVLDTCERTVLMADGRIVKDGPTDVILTDRELLEENGLELPLCLQGRTGKAE
ncbi:ABC transporter ATP-binding protein [Schaedlerella arabinosiphila]|uniref:ABC transporter ATP-binding protein n=1 Tax=Schaedlerella arabinosiphila TaxID=2044587 RepID=A0A9X5C4V4_9FIRM|nr:ABC transporter ATP-binding protein [Schaedlerella arabinosiphila]KAI4443158.1 Energy-coupling factor transporter ATP-binding protein EcfA3 [Schaedlerella arabinosiphila]MCI9604157.1 ABC transporter ATP-binding protein [Ruminococcus sp.]NDO68040.1 ABC transporter ATP-binding protein [Schaedlerella arabinosiphila]